MRVQHFSLNFQVEMCIDLRTETFFFEGVYNKIIADRQKKNYLLLKEHSSKL